MKAPSLTSGPISSHIRRIAIPISIGFFFNTMYNVVDSFYAGQISTYALAAMAMSFPVFFLIIATSEGLSRGASALLANSIGEGDTKKEAVLSAQGLSLGILSSGILTFIGLAVSKSLFMKMGADGDTLTYAMDYIQPIFIGTLFFLLSSMSNSILFAHGDSKTFGKVLILGFFLNLVLDPWFLYGGFGLPAMGIAGIAWATVAIQALGSFILLGVVFKKGYLEKCKPSIFIPDAKVFREILHQGLPASFNMMSVALGFFVITYYLQFYGDKAVAAFGVGTRIEQIALLPAIGINAAIISIVGQNNGAKKYERIQETIKTGLLYGLGLITFMSLFIYFFAPQLVGLFTSDEEVIKIGTHYIKIMAFIQWAYVMTFIHLGFLQAVKKPWYGFAESLVRKIILPLVIFAWVVNVLKVDLNGYWLTIAAINVVATIITILYAQWVLHTKIVVKTTASHTDKG